MRDVAAVRRHRGVHARRPGHRRARLRRRAALLRDRLARRRAARRGGAAALSRVGAADGVRHAPAAARRSASRRRSSRTASTCRGASSARSRVSEGVQRLDLERRLPQAPLHLQPRRHLSPHADDRAARRTGRTLELSAAQERELMQYLAQPPRGPVRLDRLPPARPRRTPEEHRRDASASIPAKPVIGLLTNVSWDAQLHYPANAFPNMLEWLVQTCEYFATRPDLQLLIRVHPAEISGFPPSRQPILARAAQARSDAGAEHPRRAAGERTEHLRADVAVQRAPSSTARRWASS